MSRICLLVFCALCVLLTAGWGWTDLIVWSPVPLISDPTADQIGGWAGISPDCGGRGRVGWTTSGWTWPLFRPRPF